MSAVAASEAAAAKEPGGPQGPVDATWLILQRLDDLRRAQDEVRADVKALDAKVDSKIDALRKDLTGEISSLRSEIDSVRNWSLGLLLLAILGLLAKLLIPGV
jgi:hypothetical protein